MPKSVKSLRVKEPKFIAMKSEPATVAWQTGSGCANFCCPLNQVKAGVAVRIKQLCASPELQNRLRELGLCEDQIIRLLTSQSNFICQVCNARLAISQQLAQLIMVEPVKPALN